MICLPVIVKDRIGELLRFYCIRDCLQFFQLPHEGLFRGVFVTSNARKKICAMRRLSSSEFKGEVMMPKQLDFRLKRNVRISGG